MSTETTAKRDLQADLVDRFTRDVTNHAMTVLHDDGLYRHLRFRQPDSAFGWFDLVTWPGSLVVRGDMGGHMFTRLDDMFQFFRRNGNDHGINPSYWAEKLSDYGDSARKYSEDLARNQIEEAVADYEKWYPDLLTEYRKKQPVYDALPVERRYPVDRKGMRKPTNPTSPSEIRERIADYDDDGELGHEDGTRPLLSELEGFGVTSDTWEWNLRDWDFRYLWCCHAIAWGIRQYDAAKAAAK